MREGQDANAPAPPGYRLRHTPRSGHIRKRGGGVGFYIKRELSARIISQPPGLPIEQMWFALNINSEKVAIGTAYRPPWFNIDSFFDSLTETICTLGNYDHILLLGDFNINLLNEHQSNAKKLLNFLNYMNLTQYVNKPTHFTEHSETLIDVVCCNTRISKLAVNYLPHLSSHAFVTCELNIKKIKHPPRRLVYRPLKDIDRDLFYEHIDCTPWEDIVVGDVNDMVNSFTTCLLLLLDIHAPIKTTYTRDYSCPWITPAIKKMMRLRDEAYARCKQTTEHAHKIYYKELKSIVNTAMHTEKRAFFNEQINYIANPRKLWNSIKSNVIRLK